MTSLQYRVSELKALGFKSDNEGGWISPLGFSIANIDIIGKTDAEFQLFLSNTAKLQEIADHVLADDPEGQASEAKQAQEVSDELDANFHHHKQGVYHV